MSIALRFLCTPITISTVARIEQGAKKKNMDPEATKIRIGKTYMERVPKERPAMCDLVNQLYLEEWSKEWINLKINFDLFGIDPNNKADSLDRKRWTDAMDTYWSNIINHANSLSEGISRDAKDDVSLIKRHMPRKLEWLQQGLIFTSFDRAIRELPIANKFIFAQIQQLFAGGQTLEDALVEVSK